MSPTRAARFLRLPPALPDRWTTLEVSSAALLGGGVWAQWGASWACMLWGAMGLLLAIVRAVIIARSGIRGEAE